MGMSGYQAGWLVRSCLAWAALGFGVAIGSVFQVVGDARLLVGVASVVFPAAAVGAGLVIARNRPRIGGVLLVLSAATPTYFAWVLNIPALVVGLVLVVAPGILIRHERGTPRFS